MSYAKRKDGASPRTVVSAYSNVPPALDAENGKGNEVRYTTRSDVATADLFGPSKANYLMCLDPQSRSGSAANNRSN